MSNKTAKGTMPFIRITKRDAVPFWKAWLFRIAAILLALTVAGLLIMGITSLTGKPLNPIDVYISMFEGAFGTSKRIWITVRDMLLLLCIGVGLAPAFKMHFWNIGAEGQILVGGVVTAACMFYFDALPSGLLLLVMMLCSLVAGALWGLLPAFFKARFGTNETLFTLMMNYVAIQITSFSVDFWDKKQSHSVGVINAFSHAGWFPSILGQQYVLNVIIVLAVAVGMFFYLKKSKHGYEIAVVGESENTARYAGINVRRVIIRTMLLSGAICGLAGFVEVSGVSHTISTVTANGRGFTAIIVAWLAHFNSFAMILISGLIAFLDRGASQIASDYNLNEFASEMITGIILFFILGSEFFINYRLIIRGKAIGGNDKS